MKYFPLAILLATALDMLQMLYRRFDVDYQEGMEVPDRWIAWGACLPLSRKPEHTFRYFMLRLPSWQWVVDWKRDNAWGWGQLTLFRFAGKWHGGYWIRR